MLNGLNGSSQIQEKLQNLMPVANRNEGLQGLLSSDLNAINEMNWEDDDYNMNGKPHMQMDSQSKFSQMNLNPLSKRIKKTVDGVSIS